ncbi:Geranylgeranyl pyrophosphate synthase [Rubrobacter radiotolerans]|uniref:Farnesyl diphosphate synthase n=1 Tax=Rubrobacter radiotolerans TaxID=42256 RepID=A0A023X411_RUBRA|nr:farnesyl diphosphate synthase [Rubrobacter radiotolerans]AHY46745.1 Geranylgeranyl pyrophosphate synthase [Rubrobacter radiotolerans]MDX5894152.1 farnesyl diphosphate synthase [Rubrobacter radiotolerans]SMC05312.1 farnesyl-diphosphate synthase [Rubrobacter radiotolerans DSM 5868]
MAEAGLERWESHRLVFEEYLEGLTFTEEPELSTLQEAMRYSMLAGGKRVRPTLCMEVARIFGAEPELALPSAAAIELIHTYSLIHDDLPAMDDDDFRRGRPTLHRKYDEAMAILAGDAFFGEALTLITVHQQGTPEQILAVVRELADSTGVEGMVGGQVLDMAQTGLGSETDPRTLRMIHRFKTGALIKSSARIGAIVAGASEPESDAVSEYAAELGLCFQIVDDLLNATSTTEALGKSAGSDEEQGKATFVGVFGLDGARREADESTARALAALKRISGDTSGLRGLALFVRHRGS